MFWNLFLDFYFRLDILHDNQIQGSSAKMSNCKSLLAGMHNAVRPHLPKGTKVLDASIHNEGYGSYTFKFGDYQEFVRSHCAYCGKFKGWNNWLKVQEDKKNNPPKPHKKEIIKKVKKGELIDTLLLSGYSRDFEWKVYAQADGDSNNVACVACCASMKAKVPSSKFSDVIDDINVFIGALEKKAIKSGYTMKQYLTETYGITSYIKGWE